MKRLLFALFLLGVTLFLFGLNYFTPLFSDDWNYAFIFGTDEPIRNLCDLAKSQYTHYMEWNGRVTAQSLAQSADSFLSKEAFSVVNSLMFIVFLYAIGLNVSLKRQYYHLILPAAFVLIFLLLPEFDLVFLWLTGACNYLWVATLLLLFHYLVERCPFTGKALLPLLWLYGFICGWSNEAFVIGMSGAYVLYYAFHRDELNLHRVVMLAGFLMGAVFLVLSPGSLQRAMTDVGVHGWQQCLQVLMSMDNLRLAPLAVVVIALLAIMRQIDLAKFLKRELWLVLAIVVSFAFVLVTTHQSGHSRMGIELFSLLLMFRAVPWHRMSGIVIGLATVAAFVVGIFALKANQECYHVNETEFTQIRQHQYPVVTTIPDYNRFLNRYIVPYSYDVLGDGFKHYGQSPAISKYFRNDSVFFLPEQFVRAIYENPERFTTFQTEETWPFYAKRENGESDRGMDYAVLEYAPFDYSTLHWPFRLVAPMLTEYNMRALPVRIQRFTLDGITYILTEKHPGMDYRLTGITLMRE